MKRILRCFMALAVIFAAACFIPALSDLSGGIKASALESGNFVFYENSDGTLYLQNYIGTDSPTTLTIPSTADGKKVTSVASDALSKVSSSLKILKIPGSITHLGSYAFRNMTVLEKVVFISSGLTDIGSNAFSSCPKLASIVLPESVKTINGYAFYNCPSLKSFKIPSKVTRIPECTFRKCTALASIAFPSTLKSFGYAAFDGTPWLNAKRKEYSSKLVIVNNILVDARESTAANITLPKGLEGIGDCAYNSNTKLKSVVIPDSCKTIGLAAFTFCENLANITLPSTITHIGGNAFDETLWVKNLSKKNPLVIVNGYLVNGDECKGAVTIPSTVKRIADWTFSQNHNITSVSIPSSVIDMGERAFGECDALKTVKIANGITAIKDKTFDHCSNLETVNIPSTVKSIGIEAFNYCEALKSISLPDSVTLIDSAAFYNCTSMSSVRLPNSAVKINVCSFGYCESLKSLTIPGKAILSEEAPFVDLTALTTLTIQEGVKSIPNYAFETCYNLVSLKLPSTLKSIGFAAFAGCNNLKYLDIPNSVTTIGDNAFNGCRKLINVKIHAGTKTIGKYVFDPNSSVFPTIICARKSAAETYAKNYKHPISYFEISTRRFFGSNRYSTAAAVAQNTYPSGCKNIVIASGSQYADALAAGTLANALDAPILLSTPTGLDNTTIARIKALKPKKAYILGGIGAVPENVATQLGKLSVSTVRISGADRYATAVSIAKNVKTVSGKTPQTVFAVCGTSYPDALSASAAAAVNGAPIIYVKPNGTLDTVTKNYLSSLGSSLQNIYVVGGEALVPKTAINALKKYCSTVVRISGANRYATNAAVNEMFADKFDSNRVCVVTGKDFPDALTASVYAAKTKNALILADQYILADTKQFLINKCPMLITAIGGTGAVPVNLLNKMVNIVKSTW